MALHIGLLGGSLKIPDTGSFGVGGTKYWAINAFIVRYYYHFYTGQGPKIPDSPVKYRTPGNPTLHCKNNV